jgi:hypothetical protein
VIEQARGIAALAVTIFQRLEKSRCAEAGDPVAEIRGGMRPVPHAQVPGAIAGGEQRQPLGLALRRVYGDFAETGEVQDARGARIMRWRLGLGRRFA